MKKIFLFALVLTSFASCKSDKKADAAAATATAQTETATEPTKNEANAAENFAPTNMKQTVAPGSPVIGAAGAPI